MAHGAVPKRRVEALGKSAHNASVDRLDRRISTIATGDDIMLSKMVGGF
jgi:hypothetical protein